MSAVADKLREARALVAKGWVQGDYAKDANGNSVYEDGPYAVCWCASGALKAARANGRPRTLFTGVIGDACIPNWNDAPGRTQAEVLAAFDKAIALAEQSL